MTRFVVVVPRPGTGEPWEIHRADSMEEAIYVATVLGSMGCPLVGIAEIEIDVDATFDALVSTLEGMPNE
jgi:hypothetical protein